MVHLIRVLLLPFNDIDLLEESEGLRSQQMLAYMQTVTAFIVCCQEYSCGSVGGIHILKVCAYHGTK